MKELSLKEIQDRLLEIMADVDAFCRKEGLRYSIAFGTLLGAVRHGGFIPWDDDIDIIMPRPDFDRFVALYPKDGRFRCLYRTKDFYAGYAKVNDPTTLAKDHKTRFHFGVNLDIFPLDAVPEDADQQYRFMHRLIHLHRRLYMRNKRFPYGSPFMLLETRFHSLDAWWKKCDDFIHTVDYGSTPLIAHMLGSSTYESVHRKELFDTLTDISFAGLNVLAFKDTHAYLTQVFGADYMTPPPENKRQGHGNKIFSLSQNC
jgi:lipopolysaccharide cholinephosphotransferase